MFKVVQYVKKGVLLLLLLLFLFLSGGGYVMAQPDPDPDIPAATAQITQKEKHKAEEGFLRKLWNIAQRSMKVAAKNAMKTFLSNMAHDAAVYLTSGLTGEKPVAYQKTPGQYFSDLGAAAGADALQTFAQDFTGFDICNPNISLKLAFTVGVGREMRPRKPKCDWQKIQGEWNKITNEKDWGKKIALSLEPQQNDIGAGLAMYQTIFNERSQAEKDATATRLITGAFKDGIDKITGEIKAPFEGASNLYKSTIDWSTKAETTFFGDIAVDTVSVFANTLFAKTMQGLVKKLLDKGEDTDLFNPEGDALADGGKQAAEARFAEFKTVDYQAPTNLDLVTEFEQCPTPIASLNNCTIDTKFSQAIREQLTVQEAMDKGLLHPDWPFGFTQFTGGSNITEYAQPRPTEGYSYNAIKRLRLYRVVPLGWEIAAEKIGSQLKNVFTLREIVEGFNTPGGQFFHMVDPQWVLKIPPQECLLSGASSILQNFNTRVEYCADVRTCLKEGPDGTCETKFGYCTREKNIWQLDGDTCPSYFNSCKSFTKTSDDTVSPLLQYTVDFDSCTADNAGCQWYSMAQNENDEWRAEPSQENRNYFNRNIEQCDAKSDGCSLFVRSQDTFGTNLVRNASFEEILDFVPQGIDDPNNMEQFLGWRWGEGDLIRAYAVSDRLTGSVALQLPDSLRPGPLSVQGLNPVEMIDTGYPLAERIFTLSFYAKDCKAYDSEAGTGSYFRILGGTQQAIQDTEVWQRYTTSLYFPPGTGQRTISFDIYGEPANVDPVDPTQNRLCTLDAVQLEEGISGSAYKNYGGVNQVGLKQPPAYLSCTGSPSDPLECAKYAKVCSEAEVGCNLFTPESYRGAPISGTARGSDLCPEACVGYRTYKQSANYFESPKFPVYFIADTAQECSLAEEGCSEFTNLDELARTGAEKLEYYQNLQQCRRPDDPSISQGVYYTWEGSEQTGYHLRTYRLMSASPYTDQGEEVIPDVTSPVPPAYIAQRGVEMELPAATELIVDLITVCNRDTYDNKTAPSECLKFYDVDGKIAYRMLSYLIVISDDCHPVRKTRYITSQEECDIYEGVWDASDFCSVEQDDCSASGGTWDDTQHLACIYQAIPSQSAQCDAQENGCREYRGNLSYTTRQAFQQNFEENPDLMEWRGDFELSSEALIAGQHSLKVRPPSPLKIPVTDALNKEVSEVNDIYLLSFTAKGRGNLKIYFEDRDNPGVFIPSDINKSFSNGRLALTNEWKPIALGPVVIDKQIGLLADGNDIENVDLVFELVPSGGEPFFIDDISLQETTDTFYLARESWNTPEVCDQNPSGVPAPQYYLGCEAYSTAQGDTRNLKSFTSLCASDKAGCEALINTQDSTSPWSATYNAFCELTQGKCSNDPSESCSNDSQCVRGPKGLDSGICVFCSDPNGCACDVDADNTSECFVKEGQKVCRFNRVYEEVNFTQQDESTEVVSGDNILYLVNTPKASCDVNVKGCTMMGLPEISLAREGVEEVNGFDTVFQRDDPDRYPRILCSQEFQGCEEYKNGSEQYYFRDPKDRICERKTVPGSNEEKWYQKYKVCEGGGSDNIICYGRTEEAQCQEGGGSCEQKTCSPQIEDFSGFADTPRKSGICVDAVQGIPSRFGQVKGCTSDLDCAEGDVCQKLWAYACEEQYDQCTAFIDGLDETRYYNLDNKRVDRSSCNGLVSQKEGCVLLSNSNVMEAQKGPVQHLYSSIATYQLSEKQNNKPVSPVDCDLKENIDVCREPGGTYQPRGVCDGGDADGYECTEEQGACPGGTCEIEYWGICRFATKLVADQEVLDESINGKTCRDDRACENEGGDGVCVLKNDSNEIVKVRRDRMCGEWLECLAEFRTEGTEQAGSGIEQSTCAALTRCRGNEPNQPFTCNEIVTDYCTTSADCHDTFGPRSNCVDSRCTTTILSEGDYRSRDTSWTGMEYSGYSLYRKYPLNEISEVESGRCRKNCSGEKPCARGFLCQEGLCQPDQGGSLGEICFTDSECEADNTCDNVTLQENRLAFIQPDGRVIGIDSRTYVPETSHTGDFFPSIVPNSCRLFPEDDAPFDKSVTDQKYKDVYRCYEGEDNWACECSYKKLDAGGARVYLGKDTEPKDDANTTAIGVCVNTKDATKRGKLCSDQGDCGSVNDGSVCQAFTEEEALYGMQGYCVEKDFSWHINGTNNPDDFACLTWYPVGLVGGFDPFNFAPEAGYPAPANRQDYCADFKDRYNDPYGIRTLDESDYVFGTQTGSPGCDDPGMSCSGACEAQGCYKWCSAPVNGLIGQYQVGDDDDCDPSDQNVILQPRNGGKREFEWEGAKVYRHATKALRFVLSAPEGDNDSWGFLLEINDTPHTPDSFEGKTGIVYQCGVEMGCIELNSNFECDDGSLKSWDTEGCKGLGETPTSSYVWGSGWFRFKVNWMKEDRNCAEDGDETSCKYILSSVEFWAGDTEDSGQLRIVAMEIYSYDLCGVTVSIVDNNIFGGPNTKAFTNRVWADPAREWVPGENIFPPHNFRQQCTPFGALSLETQDWPNENTDYGPIRFNGGEQQDQGDCKADFATVEWGGVDNAWNDDSPSSNKIARIFGSGTKVFNLHVNEATSGDDRESDYLYMTRVRDEEEFDGTYAILFEGEAWPDDDRNMAPMVWSTQIVNNQVIPNHSYRISLQGQDTGNIEGDVILPVEMSFFAYDPTGNFMPLREFIIDWDVATRDRPDEGKVVFQGSYKNFGNRVVANKMCDGTNFGRGSDGCIAKPFRISYLYTCDIGSPNLGKYGQTGKCAFRPRVRVKNNWGWTNVADMGGPDDGDPDGIDTRVDAFPDGDAFREDGCYDRTENGDMEITGCYCGDDPTFSRDTPCEKEAPESKQSWTYYEDLIIVSPPPQ